MHKAIGVRLGIAVKNFCLIGILALASTVSATEQDEFNARAWIAKQHTPCPATIGAAKPGAT